MDAIPLPTWILPAEQVLFAAWYIQFLTSQEMHTLVSHLFSIYNQVLSDHCGLYYYAFNSLKYTKGENFLSIYAISDLHLSFGSNKPMDIFYGWGNHTERIKANWCRLVNENDTVILPGDFSWGLKLTETLEDFKFLESLPGKKVILKGNHDLWWSTVKKLREFFEANNIKSVEILFNNEVYKYFLSADLGVFPGTHSVLWEQACSTGLPCIFKYWEGMTHVNVCKNVEFLYNDSVDEIKNKIIDLYNSKGKYEILKKNAKIAAKSFLYSEIAKKSIDVN